MSEKQDPKAAATEQKTVLIESKMIYPLTVSRQIREENGALKSGRRTISIVPANIQINDLPLGTTPIPSDVWRELMKMPQIATKLKNGTLKVVS